MKVVINSDHGGFGLSDEVFEEYLKRSGIEYEKREDFRLRSIVSTNFYRKGEPEGILLDMEIPRDDEVLIALVEEFGDKVNSRYSNLKVVEIPDDVDWYIEEYDGMEHVAERHRKWT